jgi:DNA-binding NarL/FixJ family response regulator
VPEAIRVLVCDDVEDVRLLLRHALELAGIQVVGEAGDGAQAIELARRLRPDVVLLDLAMPVMSGAEALPHLRSSVPEARVVVLSALDFGPPGPLDGISAYLKKGAPLGEVVAAIRRAAGGSTQGRSTHT